MFIIDDLLLLVSSLVMISGSTLFIIGTLLDEDTVKEEVKKKCPEAIKILIEKKKKNAVNVGIFDSSRKIASGVEIQSDKGVSDRLRVGQIIYL